jgi:hydrophobic/amphiphilic exporter-1 (mainly G- bacteria), HAE1 family
MLVLILVVIGTISFTRLGLDFFPDIEFPTVSVVTTYTGASSQDIEATITKPLEGIISSVNRIKKVTSITSEGVSAVTAEFEWGTNLDFAAQDVRDQIGLYKNYLPPDASEPLVVKFNFNQFPVVFWGVTSDMPPFQLKKLLEDEVKPRLDRIDGVASAMVFATDVREILVDVDKTAMESRGLTLDQIILALQASNANMPAGNLVERYSDLLVRTLGEFKSLDDIRSTLVGAAPTGQPIFLSDLAEVKDTLKDVRYEARVQGKNGVFLMVNKQSGANSAIVGNSVNKEMAAVRLMLPSSIQFHTVMDMSDMIKDVTKKTADNAWQGGLLAIVLIFFFLLNWRPTLIIGLAIPLSIVMTFIAMYAAGYTLNMLTLSGLALGVGMLVDNAIVVIENTFRHVQEGKDHKTASILGASEVGMAITASTLTTVVVFLPMVFASGITAKFTRSLALTVTFSLLASLFVALTIVPLLSSYLFRKGRAIMMAGDEASQGTGLKGKLMSWQGFEKARAKYRKALEAILRRRNLALGLIILAFILSLASVPFLGTQFMPPMDQDMLFVKLSLPVGTSLAETDRICRMVEDLAAKQSEINIVTAQIGSQAEVSPSDAASEMSATGTHEAVLYIGLVKKDFRKRSGSQVLESIRSGLPKIGGLKFESLDISSSFMGNTRNPVDIKLYGKDLEVLKTMANAMVERIRDVRGIRDATHTLAAGKPEYHLRLDRARAAQMGLMVGQIGNTIQTATIGKVATRYRDADEEIDIRVRFQERYRDSLDEIRTIPLVTMANKTVYVDQVAAVEKGIGPIKIARENQSRTVSITANVVGRDLGGVIRDVKGRLAGFEKGLPQGYFLEYGGAYEQMTDAFKILLGAFLLATLLVYMVMASQFESLLHPFIIMFTIPMGFIGVVIGLALWGLPVDMPVIIGFILLEGIAVNNGIVMIDYINQLIRGGVPKREAILQGSATRLRPVLLTALTTVLGMLPMALSHSSGSEMRAPIAVTVLAGLTATTFLTLFFIPIIYSMFEKVSFKEKKG